MPRSNWFRPNADAADPPPVTPYWIPNGVDVAKIPADLRAALAAIINPTYEALVINAEPGLDQSTGLTVVHLLWLEILDHQDLARMRAAVTESDDPLTRQLTEALEPERRVDILARHLRLARTKLKASELLQRLKEFKEFKDRVERTGDCPPSQPRYPQTYK